MRQSLRTVVPIVAAATLCMAGVAAAELPSYSITLRDKAFEPTELTVPASKKIKLEVINADKVVAEFESYDLNREKIIAGNSSVVIYIGPLNPGSYKIFNDFNQDTTGHIIAK